LVWWQAKLHNGEIVLRIDDHDETRVRQEYLENIFETLKWLGLDWDEGPKSVNDHKANYSQSLKKEHYREELKSLKDAFWCECSRKDLEGFDNGYPGICKNKNLKPDGVKEVALRFSDYVLWRKDDLPSYQWVSLVDDIDMKITHIIRGEDLRESSAFQKELAENLGWTFPQNIFHHTLLQESGRKISKSTKSSSLFEEFSSPKEFYREVLGPYLTDHFSLVIALNSAQELLCHNYNLFNRA
jgi:glutamyl/glutaminyl-tRNA synthetase